MKPSPKRMLLLCAHCHGLGYVLLGGGRYQLTCGRCLGLGLTGSMDIDAVEENPSIELGVD